MLLFHTVVIETSLLRKAFMACHYNLCATHDTKSMTHIHFPTWIRPSCWSNPGVKASWDQCNRFATASFLLKYFLLLLQTYHAVEKITLYIWPLSKLLYSSIREFLTYGEFTTGGNNTIPALLARAVVCPANSYWPGMQARYPAEGTARRLCLCYAYRMNSRCWHPVSYSMSTGCSLPGCKAAEAWNWPPTLVPRLWTRGQGASLYLKLNVLWLGRLQEYGSHTTFQPGNSVKDRPK